MPTFATYMGTIAPVSIPEYYNYGDVDNWLEEQGVKQTDENLRDDFAITAIMLSVRVGNTTSTSRICESSFSTRRGSLPSPAAIHIWPSVFQSTYAKKQTKMCASSQLATRTGQETLVHYTTPVWVTGAS